MTTLTTSNNSAIQLSQRPRYRVGRLVRCSS